MGIATVILGILSLVCSLIGTFLFGKAGAIFAGVLAAAAIVVGFVRLRKQGKAGSGVFGMIAGVLAIMMALSINSGMKAVFTELHTKAIESKPDGLWAQVSVQTDDGFVGLISRMPKDEAKLQALMDEMNELNLSEKDAAAPAQSK